MFRYKLLDNRLSKRRLCWPIASQGDSQVRVTHSVLIWALLKSCKALSYKLWRDPGLMNWVTWFALYLNAQRPLYSECSAFTVVGDIPYIETIMYTHPFCTRTSWPQKNFIESLLLVYTQISSLYRKYEFTHPLLKFLQTMPHSSQRRRKQQWGSHLYSQTMFTKKPCYLYSARACWPISVPMYPTILAALGLTQEQKVDISTSTT